MDYSKYYLKNYKEEDSLDINYQNMLYEYYKKERDLSNLISNVIIGSNHANKDNFSEHYEIIDNENNFDQHKNKKTKARFIVIISCFLLITFLSTIVITDILTKGQVIMSFIEIVSKEEIYYLSYKYMYDDLYEAKSKGAERRLLGYGGLIYHYNDLFYVIDNVSEENLESSLKIELKREDLEIFPKELRKQLAEKINVNCIVYDKLKYIEEKKEKDIINDEEAKEEIGLIVGWYLKEYKSIKAITSSFIDDNNVVKLLSKFEAIRGVIMNLLDETISRPNYICDIRYSIIQILLI